MVVIWCIVAFWGSENCIDAEETLLMTILSKEMESDAQTCPRKKSTKHNANVNEFLNSMRCLDVM